MSVIKACSSNSAKVGIDGVPLAGVELAEEYERHSEYPVLGFGDCVPSAILTYDRRYEIVLERSANIGDGVRFENAEPFELQIGGRLYSGCRCTELRKTKKPDGSEVQRIKIAALCCEEVSGDE